MHERPARRRRPHRIRAAGGRRFPERDAQTRDRDVRDRPDSQRVHHRPDPDRPAEQPAGDQDRELDRGSHDTDRMTARGEAGHQPVARAGSEAGADVGAGGDPVQDDAAEHHHDLGGEAVDRGHDREHHVDHETDQHHVTERAEPRLLAERDPQEQDEDSDDDRPGADAEAEPARQALMEHVPGVDAEAREQQHRTADTEQHETGVKLDQAAHAWGPHPRDHAKPHPLHGDEFGRQWPMHPQANLLQVARVDHPRRPPHRPSRPLAARRHEP